MLITTDSSSADSSSDAATIPVIVGVTGGVFSLMIIALFVFIFYFKCLRRKDPYADVSENSLHESKLHEQGGYSGMLMNSFKQQKCLPMLHTLLKTPTI